MCSRGTRRISRQIQQCEVKNTPGGAAERDGAARPRQIVPGPEVQQGDRQPDGHQPLRDLDADELADAGAGRVIPRHDPAQAGKRKQQAHDPQARPSAQVAQPCLRKKVRQEEQRRAGDGAHEDAVLQTGAHGRAHTAQAPVAEFLRRQIHGRYAYPGRPGQHGKNADGRDELHQAQPRRADAHGEEDLKRNGDEPQQQICRRQKQRAAQNGVVPLHALTSPVQYIKTPPETCLFPGGSDRLSWKRCRVGTCPDRRGACSPFRVPIARLAAAQAAIREQRQ